MTREEAINWLKEMKDTIELYNALSNSYTFDKFPQAIDMAISALTEHKDCTDFLCWLLEEIMDEENWEINAEADGEIIARKLKKLGLLDSKDGYYVRTPMYEALTEPSDLISHEEAWDMIESDLISRADAIEAVREVVIDNDAVEALKALPSAEQVTSKLKNPRDSLLTDDKDDSKEQKSKLDLISRADVLKYPIRLDHYDEVNGSRVFVYGVESVIEYVESLPSADAVPIEKYHELQHQFVMLGAAFADLTEVVRCKDCRHADECHKSVQYTRNEPRTVTMGYSPIEWCSHGERREP